MTGPRSREGIRGPEAAASQARATLPAFRHEAHTLTRFGVPPTTVRTDWMFGFQRRLVRRWECEMLWPKPGPTRISESASSTQIAGGPCSVRAP